MANHRVCGLGTGDHLCGVGDLRRPTRAELQSAHGTPREFRVAVFKAARDGWVTHLEADTASRQYDWEWTQAL